MLILGVDPGTVRTGYGVVDSNGTRHRCLDYGVIKLPRRQQVPEKLARLHQGISDIVGKYAFDSMALEDLFYATNVQSALRLSQARGVIMLAAAQHDLMVYEYSPLEIKNAVVGYGRAEKSQIQEMLRQLLHLEQRPEPDDAADALAVAVCHAQTHASLSRLREAEIASSQQRP